MPSASPFEGQGGLICGINKSSDTSQVVVGSGWDCDEYFPMCEDLFTYTVSVVHNNNNNSSSSSSVSSNNSNPTTVGMTMAPHLGHLISNSSNHQALPQPQQQQQQQHLAVDVSPDASVVHHPHNHLHHHHQHHQQQQQQQHHPSDFMIQLMPVGAGQNTGSPTTANNNNNNTNNMNINSSTSHKIIPVFSSSFSSGAWEKKLPADWDENDTIDWLFAVANKQGIPCEYFASFGHLRGSNLLEMNKEDFQSKYPSYGHKFYEAFRQLIHQLQQQQQQQHSPPIIEGPNATDLLGLQNSPVVHHHQSNSDCWSMMPPAIEQQNYLHSNGMVLPDNNIAYCGAQDRQQYSQMDSSYVYLNSANHHSHHHHQSKGLAYGDPLQVHSNGFQHQQQQQQQQHHESYDSYSSLDIMGDHYENYSNGTPSDPEEIMAPNDAITINTGGLKRVGRPTGNKPNNRRRKQDRGYGKLWEFIRDLLHDPKYCPSMVRWEDVNDGVFRIVQSEKLANLWGTIKNNPRMTYEKLSRAMRYYYKSKVFLPVLGRRLVYKFGPHAVLWKPENPNFEQPSLDGQT